MYMFLKISRSHLASVAGPMNIKKPLKSWQKLSKPSCTYFFESKEHIFKESYYKFMVQTEKLKDNLKESAGVKRRKTYRYIFNCLQTRTKWKVKQSKKLNYTNENWLTISSSAHTNRCRKNFNK